jgi:hypothetical protein
LNLTFSTSDALEIDTILESRRLGVTEKVHFNNKGSLVDFMLGKHLMSRILGMYHICLYYKLKCRYRAGITITPTPIPPHPPPFQSYRGEGGGGRMEGGGDKTDLLYTIMYLVLFISLQIAPRLHHILYCTHMAKTRNLSISFNSKTSMHYSAPPEIKLTFQVQWVKGTVTRDEYFFEGLNILISTFCV